MCLFTKFLGSNCNNKKIPLKERAFVCKLAAFFAQWAHCRFELHEYSLSEYSPGSGFPQSCSPEAVFQINIRKPAELKELAQFLHGFRYCQPNQTKNSIQQGYFELSRTPVERSYDTNHATLLLRR